MKHANFSRLRKGGMIRAAIAVATVAAAAAPMAANAAVVTFGGGQTNANGDATISINGTPIFDLIQKTDGANSATIGHFSWLFSYVGAPVSDGSDGLYTLTNLSPGDVVGRDQSFQYGGGTVACLHGAPDAPCGNFTPGTSGYFGFSIWNESLLPTYGWAKVSLGQDGTTLTLLGGAYETTPFTSITIPSDVVSSPAAVPESATWAMMIAGFGMVGGTMRSRRRRSVLLATAIA